MENLQVVALALDGVVAFDLGCAVQAFRRGPGRDGAAAGFEMTTCGVRAGTVATPDGFALRVEHGLEALETADIVVVPGRHPHDARPPERVLVALREAHDRGAVVMSICIGSFVLAYAGLLDGRPATTHWDYSAEFARRFPMIDVQPDRLYVDDGDILTSAGLAAGMDLCLHVVRREAGANAASQLACWNVVAPHREGGQAQFIPPPLREAPADGLGATLAWAVEHLGEPLTVRTLAEHAHIGERTFNRHFAAQVGTTPKRWLLDQRVGLARELLERGGLSVDQIAREAGFASTPALRSNLRRQTSTTPTAYRRSFTTDASGEPDDTNQTTAG